MPQQPIRNPDGTLQVAPPTMSAFAPQATQPPPPPVTATIPGGAPPPSPGIAGAIHDMIAALASAFAPRSITQAKQRTDQAVNDAQGASQPSLADELGK